MQLVSTGQLTINDYNDGMTVYLSNEGMSLPADINGTVTDYSGASTTFFVYLGQVDDSASWTVTATPSTGVVGSFGTGVSLRTYTVTSLTAASAYVDFNATKQGFQPLYRRFSLSISRAGATGSTGNNGAPGTPGNDGLSRKVAYCASSTITTNTAPATTTGANSVPGVNQGGITGTWQLVIPTVTSGQFLWVCEGSYNPITNQITWNIPYWSTARIGKLSSMAVDTGTLNISESISSSNNNFRIDNTGLATFKSLNIIGSDGKTILASGDSTLKVTALPSPSRGDAINDDPAIEDLSSWVVPTNISRSTGDLGSGQSGLYYFSAPSFNGEDRVVMSTRSFNIDPNKIYGLYANLYTGATNNRDMYLLINFYDSTGAQLSTSWGGTYSGYAFGGVPPISGAWGKCGNNIGLGTARPIPASARTAKVGVWFQYTGSGSTNVPQAAQDIRLTDLTDVVANGGTTFIGRGCNVNGATVTATTGGWANDAYSSNGYTGGAFVTLSPGVSGADLMFGLNSDPQTSRDYTTLDFAIYLNNNNVRVYESNVDAGVNYTTYTAGDTFTVSYDGVSVRYDKNGTVFKTTTPPNSVSTVPLYFDCSFSSASGSLKNIRFGPQSSNTWASIGGPGKAADNATVGAQAGVNLVDSVGVPLTDALIRNGYTENGVGHVTRPLGGSYSATTAVTGILKVDLPTQTYTGNTMVKFVVEVYEAAAGRSCTYTIGGNTAATWANVTAEYSGPTAGSKRVRFGTNASTATRQSVYIGDTTTVWQSPQVRITEVVTGYNNYDWSLWNYGWAISLVTAVFGVNLEVTQPSMGSEFNKINTLSVANVPSYIEPNAITDTQIGGNLKSTNWNGSTNETGAGWLLERSTGNFYGNNAVLRGAVMNGGFTSYAWPTTKNPDNTFKTGYYLGPEGLLLGNAGNGKYFQVDSQGNVLSPQFTSINGVATFSGVLAANIITSGNIQPGAITSDRLKGGLGSANILPNSSFLSRGVGANQYPDGWYYTANGNANSFGGINMYSDRTPTLINTFMTMNTNGANTTPEDVYSDPFPVVPGVTYEASAYGSNINARQYFVIVWYTGGAGNYIGGQDSTSQPMGLVQSNAATGYQQPGSEAGFSSFQRIFALFTAPNNASQARLFLRKDTPAGVQSNAFWCQPYFGVAASTNQTVPSPYAPTGNGTQISGGQIRTGTITADRLGVTQLDAIAARIGTLRTAVSGARTEISDNVIKVYDGNGTLRVKIGDLSL